VQPALMPPPVSDTGSVTLTRDPTRPDPTKIVDPVTHDPKIRFQQWNLPLPLQ